jgi:hypothetical protein
VLYPGLPPHIVLQQLKTPSTAAINYAKKSVVAIAVTVPLTLHCQQLEGQELYTVVTLINYQMSLQSEFTLITALFPVFH